MNRNWIVMACFWSNYSICDEEVMDTFAAHYLL